MDGRLFVDASCDLEAALDSPMICATCGREIAKDVPIEATLKYDETRMTYTSFVARHGEGCPP